MGNRASFRPGPARPGPNRPDQRCGTSFSGGVTRGGMCEQRRGPDRHGRLRRRRWHRRRDKRTGGRGVQGQLAWQRRVRGRRRQNWADPCVGDGRCHRRSGLRSFGGGGGATAAIASGRCLSLPRRGPRPPSKNADPITCIYKIVFWVRAAMALSLSQGLAALDQFFCVRAVMASRQARARAAHGARYAAL